MKNTLITKMYTDSEIEDSVFHYLQDKERRTPHMYFLPKIHKGIIPPPDRPIGSANGCPTEKKIQICWHFLNTPSTLNKSYVKNTWHFLKLIRYIGVVPSNSYLVTLDATSLYTNIPTHSGIQTAKKALENSDQTLISNHPMSHW